MTGERVGPRSRMLLASRCLSSIGPGMMLSYRGALILCSPLSGAVTGMTVYVDNGMHSMGMVQEVSIEECRFD